MENVLRGELQSKVAFCGCGKLHFTYGPLTSAFRQKRVSGVRGFGWPAWSARQTSRQRFASRTESWSQRHRLPLGKKLGCEIPSLPVGGPMESFDAVS